MIRKKLGLTATFAIMVSIMIVAVNLLLGGILMNSSKKSMLTLIQNRMLDISNTAAAMLDGDELENLKKEDKGTPKYQKINDTLAYFQDNIDLKYIYCVTAKGDKEFVFSVDPTIDDPGIFGEPVVYTDALYAASKGTPSVDEEPYSDDWGRFYSAYSPVFDSEGKVAGIVAVDFDAEWYDWQFRKQTISIFVNCIASVVIGLIFVFFVTGKLLQTNNMITALSSEYRGVYYINLDEDDGICYQTHSKIDNGIARGKHFPYTATLTKYANEHVSEAYREEFIRFIAPESIRENLKNEKVCTFRYMIDKDGQQSYEMIRMAGVRHPESRHDGIVHAVGMGFADVDAETRRTFSQSQALADALAAAESANKAKTSFLSSMSHEIRTPMNAIIGINRVAMDDPGTPEATKAYLKKIGASADHLLMLINDILDMSRIESGRMVLKKEAFSLDALLDQVNVIIGGQCREKGLIWIFEKTPEADGFYMGDDMKIKQVLINILGNSVKFTNEGGSVALRVDRVTHYGNETVLKFVISDTGVGIDSDFLPRLFDTFSQEDSSTTTKYGSTGLGMSITKSIIDMMNGSIQVESEKDVGSTFTVTIPLEASKEEAVEVPSREITDEPDYEVLEGRRILLAEDMEINAEIIKMLLDARKIHVDHAENGRIAVEKFTESEEHYYDGILMDVRMPEMDGLEATSQIRTLDRKDAKEIPIIALTANAFEEDVQRSLQSGLNAHLSKPIDADILFSTLIKLMK